MIAAAVMCATLHALLRTTIAVTDNNLLLAPNPHHRLHWHHLILQLVRQQLLPPAEQDLDLINRLTSAIGLYTYGSQLADMSLRPGDEACGLGVQQQSRDVQPPVVRDVCACAAQGIDPVCPDRYYPKIYNPYPVVIQCIILILMMRLQVQAVAEWGGTYACAAGDGHWGGRG
jgi:hypothetical protein